MTGSARSGAKALGAAALAVSAAWVLIALTTWRHLANGGRVGSPWSALDGQTLLLSVPVQAPVVLGGLALHALATVVGYAWVTRTAWGERRLVSTLWLVAAGFVPGMLFFLAVSRLTSLLLPNTLAPGVIWGLHFAAAGLALWGLWRQRPPAAPTWAPPPRWSAAAILAVVFVGLLVFGVQIDRMHVMGSASHDFTHDIYLNGQHALGAAGHFPLISQHYDEPAYLYPLVYGLLKPGPTADGTMTVVYWMLLALGRLSVGSLVFLSLRSLGLDRMSAFALTVFVWAASLSLNPVASNVLFDSFSPLANVLHIARLMAPVTPLLVLGLATGLTRSPGWGALAVAFMIGAGLSAMSVQVGLVVAWTGAVLALTAISPNAARSPRLWAAGAAACILVLAVFSFAYGFQSASPVLRAGLMLASALLGVLGVIVALLRGWLRREDPDRLRLGELFGVLRKAGPIGFLRSLGPSVPYWAALAAGYATAFVFFGNVLVRAFDKRLGGLWPWPNVPYWDRYYGVLATKKLVVMESPFCAAGDAWGFRILTEHCGSLPLFVRTYGLSFVAATAVIGWQLRRTAAAATSREPAMPDRTLTMVFWGAVLCMLAQPLGFVVYDFIFGPDITEHWARHLSIWLRVRLLEPWFYGALLIPAALFLRHAGPRQRFWTQSAMLAAAAIYFMSPFITPAQMTLNAAYLAATVLGVGR